MGGTTNGIVGFTVNYWVDTKLNMQSTYRSYSCSDYEWKHCRELDSIAVIEKSTDRVALYIPFNSLISIVGFANEEEK